MLKNIEFIDKLRSSGLRPTKQRLKICEVLFNREKTFHFTINDLAKNISDDLFEYKDGIYAWFTGPTYETPAEVNFAKIIGADLVGMSTVPEAIVANHAGINVAAFSLVTNLAAGISKEPLSHEEVIEIANLSKNKLQNFMEKFLTEINLTK